MDLEGLNQQLSDKIAKMTVTGQPLVFYRQTTLLQIVPKFDIFCRIVDWNIDGLLKLFDGTKLNRDVCITF